MATMAWASLKVLEPEGLGPGAWRPGGTVMRQGPGSDCAANKDLGPGVLGPGVLGPGVLRIGILQSCVGSARHFC